MTFLQLLKDPERRARSLREQEEARGKFPHVASRHPAEANYLFGLAREGMVRTQFGGKVGRSEQKLLRRRLGEGLALQARFEEAAKATTDRAQRRDYLRKAKALAHLGEPLCGHPETTVKPSPTDAKGKRERTRQRFEEVFDGRIVIALLRCQACGRISAEAA